VFRGLLGLRQEIRPMIDLAGPVVLAELGWMSMGLVDTMMVGRVGPEAIGAVSIGGVLFLAVGIFGMGLLLGLDTLVSQAFGAGRLEDCHRSLFHGVYLSLALTAPLCGLVTLFLYSLDDWGIDPRVLPPTVGYLRAINWSMLPLLLYASFRRYLQGMNLVKPVMFALISANGINVLTNWVLIFGKFGAPALGAVGAGWATFASRTYMAGFLLVYIVYYDRRHRTGLWHAPRRLDLGLSRCLVALGLPAALQITLEVGVFALATTLAGRLDPVSLAAHQIALSAASFTFMVPLGVSSAGAVRVGQALGRRDPEAAGRSGWTALVLGAAFMSCAALAFIVIPRPLVRIFTDDPTVISIGVSLLLVAAFFQLFDGLQVVATGVLRGAGDTRTPMIVALIGHWLLGLPVGYALCFVWDRGITGLWIGLSLGLISAGVILLGFWSRQVRTLSAELPALGASPVREV
jgi:MATE family multidrug resistance protein